MSTAVAGVQLGVAQAGIKKANHDDLVVIALAPGTRTAALFTQNAFRAAPVQLAEAHLAAAEAQPRYLLINTGNANAGTGEAGFRSASACCDALARLTETDASAVLPFSTGVIGEPLSAEQITTALPAALDDLCDVGWERAAGAILTTDTRAKLRSIQVELDGQQCTITGIAKGAGMICPNMATMLAFVATDAAIEVPLLGELLSAAAQASFNRITVDGDTSTNDAVTLSATGQSGIEVTAGSEHAEHFVQSLTTLMIELAQDIVRDGEGASKFVEIRVTGGESEAACDQVARTVAHSPLVKTALFASDPNWGRILAAIGRAGLEDLDTDAVSIHLNGVLIAEHGARASSYTEEKGQEAMASGDLLIEIALDRGDAATVIWTTDLSYDYVRINAEYRT
ncbi:MAG: bifunctional glutamate N-acetyltransferase/amino-acid acetyltransferase ArgJ [Gammaproteobacteria bacterium]|nr:bifunctional glutamate N-acetyltransferase/amino-acid acetyltransferase ArgJ [Gammaproteobacteria bacterium]